MKAIVFSIGVVVLALFVDIASAQETVDYGSYSTNHSIGFDENMEGFTPSSNPRGKIDSTFTADSFGFHGGTIAIIANDNDGQYTSGQIISDFSQSEGYVEVLAKLPVVKASWPLMTLVDGQGNEIRFLESVNDREFYVSTVLNSKIDYNTLVKTEDSLREFHLYSVRWDDTGVTWYFDGERVAHQDTTNWNKDLRLLINLGVGGWAGKPDPWDYPASIVIDYVNAYSFNDESEDTLFLDGINKNRPITYQDLQLMLDALEESWQQ